MKRAFAGVSAVFLLVAAAVWLVWHWLPRFQGAEPVGPERFVLIVADALRADHLGCYGYEKSPSPNIDTLAERSIRFAECWSVGPYTFPSNAGLFTGMYPYEVANNERTGFRQGVTVLGEHFKREGYATAGFFAHPVLAGWGFGRGLDTCVSAGRRDNEATDACVKWLREHADSKYFVVVYLFDPHMPYDPEHISPDLHDKIAMQPGHRAHITSGRPPLGKTDRCVRVVENAWRARDITQEELDILHGLYEADIADTDRRVGRILHAIGDDRRTVIAFVSDHGEEWMEHGGLNHQRTMYSELLHIPCILHVPGQRPAVVETPVSNIDVTRTLLELAGIDATHLRGQALVPTSQIESRPLYSEVQSGTPKVGYQYAVRLDDEALIHTTGDWSEWSDLRRAGFERFDLASDPQQKNPLPVDDGRLRSLLLAYEDDARKGATAGPRSATKPLSPELRRQLRDLGYLAP